MVDRKQGEDVWAGRRCTFLPSSAKMRKLENLRVGSLWTESFIGGAVSKAGSVSQREKDEGQ